MMRLWFSAAIAIVAVAAGSSVAIAIDRPGGALLTPPDVKQSILQAPAFRDFLPQAVDLSQYMPPVGDQGQQGSCVGWATAYAARAYYAEQVEHRDIAAPANQPSPAWVYDIIHQGDASCNGGSRIPDAMKVLMQGAYSLSDFPYSDTACPRPPVAERSKPTDFKIDGFEQVYDAQGDRDLDKVKGALAKGEPVVTLVILDPAFMNLSPADKVWQSDSYQSSRGGHAITLVGYDDRTGLFKFINSWSTEWGDAGYGYMTYDTYVARTAEAYTMQLPGDPDITLSSADLDPPQISLPPRPVAPKPLSALPPGTRDFGDAAEAPPDVGPLSCGRVDISTDARGNTTAKGFVGTQAELDRVNEALSGKVDENDVTLAPWPACELQLTLAAPLEDTDTPQLAIDPAAPKFGDDVHLAIQTPGFASYIYAASLASDGTVSVLLQPGADRLKARTPHARIALGEGAGNGPALVAGPPAGTDTMIVLASEKPLFDEALPGSLSARAFLSALRVAILAGDAGRVTAALSGVTTGE